MPEKVEKRITIKKEADLQPPFLIVEIIVIS
jgi:hypothetical protein